MKRFSRKQILLLHEKIISISGGSKGVRDENLLLSAIISPYQTFGGKELYPSLIEKAVRLGYNLISNHPFIDGNKRIGVHAFLVYLDIHDVKLEYDDEDLIKLIFQVASGLTSYEELLEWVKRHVVSE
ncbi:MAG: type II toxin-antitoxin system death-on-curing family toxin [Synergistaceae bacterium]|nr:type II toxin-antitoxin system death-on-curing family toxin [Synergistaceae bacterium]